MADKSSRKNEGRHSNISNTFFTNKISQHNNNNNIVQYKLCKTVTNKNCGKGKVHPRTGHEVPEGE